MSPQKRKKIVFIAPAYPYRGGNTLTMSYFYETLKDIYDVKVYNYKLLYPSFLFPGTTQYDTSEKVYIKSPNIRAVNSINPFNWFEVARMLKKENADLIAFDWWHPFFSFCHYTISRLIKSKYKNRILFITENFISHEANPVDKLLTRIGLSNASSFMALSGTVAQDLKTLSGKRKIYRSELPIYDCYNPADAAAEPDYRAELGLSPDDKVILFFGYVRKYKGLDILINAFPGIKKNFPEAKLLIVGEFYDNPAPYLELIEKLNIKEDTILVNKYVSNEDVGRYFLSSDLLVLPYRSATQSGILNMAYGFLKPSIVTGVGGLSEFVVNGKTGLIIPPESPDEVIKGVNKFFELKKTEDFRANITAYINSSKFNKLPGLFEEIIADTEN